MEKIKAVFKFEEVNFDYFNQQINGVLCEIEQKHQDEGYIAEKINNCKRFFAEVLDNFHRRMTTTSGLPTRERLQSEFKAIVNGDAQPDYPQPEIKEMETQ